jgi:glycosyltransferase involved in cell wall biosynthesis
LENQNYSNWTHVIIDGFSSDGTRDYLDTLNSQNSVSISEPDSGLYQAMNKSLRLLPINSYVIFLNARDVLVDNWALYKSAEALAASGYPLWGCTTHEEISDSGLDWVCKLVSTPSIPNQLYAFGYRSHQGVVMRASFIENLGGFDEKYRYASDWDLIAKALSKSLPCTWIYPLARFELGGFSSQNLLSAHLELREIRKVHLVRNFRQLFFDELWCSVYLFQFGYTNMLTPIVNLLLNRRSLERSGLNERKKLRVDRYRVTFNLFNTNHFRFVSKIYKLLFYAFNTLQYFKHRFRSQLNLYFILYLHKKLGINRYETSKSLLDSQNP